MSERAQASRTATEHLVGESDSCRGLIPLLFDPKYDSAFQGIVSLGEAIFGTRGVRISFPSGDTLKARAVNSGELFDVPLNATLCGMAVLKGESLEYTNAQTNPEARSCPAVQRSGVSFYANRLIRVGGGEVVGTLCVYDDSPRSLGSAEHRWLDALGEITGQLVQGIVNQAGRNDSREVSMNFSGLDFSSLFELSPVPTAVLSYPDYVYIAANNPSIHGCEMPMDEILGGQAAGSGWFRELRELLESQGKVEDLEVTFKRSDGAMRHLLLDGRLIEVDGNTRVLVTGRDVTKERERERSLRLLLEGTNFQFGEDWFRSAAAALAELTGAEQVVILEALGGASPSLVSHAVWDSGSFCANYEFEFSAAEPCPVFSGESVVIRRRCSRAVPLLSVLGSLIPIAPCGADRGRGEQCHRSDRCGQPPPAESEPR